MVGGMRRLLLLVPLAVIATSATAAERRYSLTDFDRIRVDGPYQVRLTTGASTRGSASGSQQALDALSIEVQGSTLRIRRNASSWGGFPGQKAGAPAEIVIATRTLRAASVGGSGSLLVDKARGLQLDLTIAGNGRIAVGAVDADNLAVTMIGSGRLSLAGRAKQAKLNVQGAGEVDAASFSAADLQLTAETAGNIALAAGRTARVRSTGAGDVTISGNPACTVDAQGAGTVRCGRGG
jgi:hypothetical protein